MQRVPDDASRRALLLRALEAWRSGKADRFRLHGFYWMLQAHWSVFGEDEARTIVREIVGRELEAPDMPDNASYQADPPVHFTSSRQNHFFQVLHILRRLDPPLAEELIAGHEQLSAAALRFPLGWETIRQEAEEKARNALAGVRGGGFVMAGSRDDFDYMRSLIQADEDGDFESPVSHAISKYLEDIAPESPNQAPREFWPSTAAFRSVVYRAARRLGRDGAVGILEKIPDRDIRQFAQIELAAALAGLPELPGVQHRSSFADSSRRFPRPPKTI
jgi:hypothetical protein